jgi:hypothetical protein
MLVRYAEIQADADEPEQQGGRNHHDGPEQEAEEQRRIDDDQHVAHLELRHAGSGREAADEHDGHAGDDDGRAGDPLVVPVQLRDHRGREDHDECRARNSQAQQIDRLQNGVRQRCHRAAHVDGGDDGHECEINRRGPARASQGTLHEVGLKFRLGLRGET